MTVALYFTVDGPEDAPALLLGPSLGSTVDLWQPQRDGLAGRYRLIRYDHRGHGGSPVVPGPYRIEDLGRDVLALMDRLGLARAHLGGASLGGMVGMWIAENAPERVDRLLLACTSARLGPPELWAGRAAAVRAGGMAAVADAVLARWFTPAFAQARPDVARAARRMLLATPPEGYAGCCAAIETMDLVPDLGRITAPTLVIAGGDDPAIPPGHGKVIVDAVSLARLAVIPAAAHAAGLSHPDEVTRLMLDFLKESHE